jgi:short-subunit dehydrogenase
MSVLITGSGRGLGAELAIAFAKENHDIILHGRNLNNLTSVREKINTRTCIIVGDIRHNDTLDNIEHKAHKWNVNVLVNNAGMSSIGVSFVKVSNDDIEEMIQTNVISQIKLIHRLYKLISSNKGAIININSICGLEPKHNRVIYCASRWAMRGFDVSLRMSCEQDGIRLITVYPSRIKTRPEFTEGMEPSVVVDKIIEMYYSKSSGAVKIDDRPDHLRPNIEDAHYA